MGDKNFFNVCARARVWRLCVVVVWGIDGGGASVNGGGASVNGQGGKRGRARTANGERGQVCAPCGGGGNLIFLALIISPSIGGNFTPKTATENGAQYVSPSSHSHIPKSDPRLRQPCSEVSPIIGEKIKVAFSVIFVNKRQLFTEKPVR